MTPPLNFLHYYPISGGSISGGTTRYEIRGCFCFFPHIYTVGNPAFGLSTEDTEKYISSDEENRNTTDIFSLKYALGTFYPI